VHGGVGKCYACSAPEDTSPPARHMRMEAISTAWVSSTLAGENPHSANAYAMSKSRVAKSRVDGALLPPGAARSMLLGWALQYWARLSLYVPQEMPASLPADRPGQQGANRPVLSSQFLGNLWACAASLQHRSAPSNGHSPGAGGEYNAKTPTMPRGSRDDVEFSRGTNQCVQQVMDAFYKIV